MSLITWGSEYSVGIEKIDEQHQKIIMLMNTLHEAMKEGKAKNKLELILAELAEYTVYHFQYEEELFAKYAYSNKLAHTKEHNALRDKVLDLNKKMKSGEKVITHDLLRLLQTWINNHIQSVDKKYSQELISKMA